MWTGNRLGMVGKQAIVLSPFEHYVIPQGWKLPDLPSDDDDYLTPLHESCVTIHGIWTTY